MKVYYSLITAILCLTALTVIFLSGRRSEENTVRWIEEQVSLRFEEFESILDGKRRVAGDIITVRYDSLARPVMWSDNDYIPTLDLILNSPNSKLLSTEYGEYLYSYKITGNSTHAVFSPLRRLYNLSSEYDRVKINHNIIPHGVSMVSNGTGVRIQYNEDVLFYVSIGSENFLSSSQTMLIKFLYLLLIISLFTLVYQIASRIIYKIGVQFAVLLLCLILLVLRLIAHTYGHLPFLDEFSLFDPSVFHFRSFYPSLGDGILNVISISTFLIFILFNLDGFAPKRKWLKIVFVISSVLGTYLALYAFASSIYAIGVNSNVSLDISTSLEFTSDRIAGYLLVGLLAIMFFLIHSLSFRLVKSVWVKDRFVLMLHLISLGGATLLLVSETMGGFVLVINALYIFSTYKLKMPETLSSLKFQSVNYLMFTGIVLAGLSALSVYKAAERKELYQMQRFISYLQVDRDIEGEFILSDILEGVSNDTKFLQYYTNELRAEKLAKHRLEKYYLNTYFSNFEVVVQLYDSTGNYFLNSLANNFEESKKKFDFPDYKTAYPNIFYDGKITHNKRKRYISFVELGNRQGFMRIEMTMKKFSSKRVLPLLLASRRMLEKSGYSYAFIADGGLNYTSGSFEYASDFDMKWLGEVPLYNVGIEREGYHHLGAEFGGKITVVSQKVYQSASVISNFSFYFILLFFVLGLVSVIMVKSERNEGIYLSFSTKIMLYSAVSFIVPLILVASAVLTTTDRTNKKEIEKSNLKRTALLTENLDDPLSAYAKKRIGKVRLEDQINQLAAYSGMDISLYGKSGVLLASSTPEIFNKGILSKYLNPAAVSELFKSDKDYFTMSESIGKFQYKTSYVRINSPVTGEVLGVLASPYFGIKNYVKRQQLQVFGDIINIFTLVFILSIGVAYWVIARLTQPIVDVADKLHDTGFVNDNQPIEWESDDEIGILVNEYNNMLAKLEETKVELARNEKEAAWREMAKQVAHEIKNPLTPMKLSIQHLNRVFADQPNKRKTLDNLLAQVDTLDEIVTSFSHFAKMPTPLNEPFNFGEVLQRSVDLHVDKRIDLEIPMEACIVSGDKKLFGRIFNNLILNGFQAMKDVENPMMMVRLFIHGDNIVAHFQDEGEGIDEENRDKVFIPNFSTKETGSGIGLAVAKRGIEHAGGNIWFESEPGHTTFMISMPLWKDETVQNNA
ncbi:sensor histidine kinase [Reichenbachiella versicolor]|uniref:sensor histidine kinase n=1 Tax=Reichenbachiella versicolor TaxID=1821036 RepID=UPI000D6E3D12|nr:HAMP domain-containing sensor histidine kinase [Reichenbachiella versicolor]